MRARVAMAAAFSGAVVLTAPATAAAADPLPDTTRTVTLITGDRLQIAPDGGSATRLPSPGRDGIPLISRFAGGRLQVLPADAAPLLGEDRLDPRLFDVSGLLEAGYDDTGGDLPLIITYQDKPAAPAVGAAAGGAPVQDLPAVNGSAVRVRTARLATAWAALSTGDLRTAYRKVWLDGTARPSTDVSVPLVGAPAAWAQGLTGGGVRVGLLDTGVDAAHPDLAGAIAETADFTGGDGVDRSGHGTHVASIIAGSGAASGGRYRGMAPDVRIVSAKVCEAGRCPESAVLDAMLWAARDQRLKVVNLSLGMPGGPGTDLLEQAVGTLTEKYGTLFVAAAGNTGPVDSPASADAALAVAATGGPRSEPGARSPDLAAPGTGIVAARSGDSALAAAGPRGVYARASGSSVATPHVTGAAAILAQQHPDRPPAAIKAALMSAASPAAAVEASGAGRLDVARAVSTPVTASPARLSGAQTVTYTNTGATDVTLALSTSDASFTVEDSAVTVPARGEASVRVSAASDAGPVTGVLTAASGDITVRTPLGAVPSSSRGTVALTVRATGRSGTSAGRFSAAVRATDGDWITVPSSGTLRLPRGTYTVDGQIFEDTGTTLLDQPALVLGSDTTVDLDARLGRPVTVAVPGPGAVQVHAQVAVAAPGGATASVQDDRFDGLRIARIGPDDDVPGFRTEVTTAWTAPGATSWSLGWAVPGRYPTGFGRAADPGALAEVRADYAASAAGATGVLVRSSLGGGHATTLALPARRSEIVNTDGGVRWGAWFTDAASGVVTAETPAEPRAGAQTWNRGPFGPDFGAGITRAGNTLTVRPSWFTDREDRAGQSATARHRLIVARNGKVLSDTTTPAATVTAPAATGTFTVTDETDGRRTKWTFRSGATAAREPVAAPVVRFAPRRDDVLAVTVRHQAGGRTARLALQVSYDEGGTWREPLTTRIGEQAVAFLRPPAGGGTVSVKAAAADEAGNTVEQTILRAYAH